MTSDFKRGDKVVCTQPISTSGPRWNLPADTVFTVTNSHGLSLEIEGRTQSFSSDRFAIAPADAPSAPAGALTTQVGGAHYKDCAIQPVEFIHANGLPFIEGSVVKYVSRWRKKGGVQDLKKARHFLEMLIEMEERPAA
ncbi:hypothetical protein DMC25_06480 [Caulobacter sp. D4A]|uniref:DUF3310 domain-containing protein n=1 Tax=unclassified Caulobacter TaxID=2648921 RepID=UPI000D72D311|nr:MULTISPECIES: DUF3310 domain-containing protein [unclassified Caulobacter]PXA91195.1 hypothetical protein DMC25_06480 [Caulobacter sp. D4A]PXA96784.1 hypothetical protein DMC18_00540 [Caulobacter sp. D5]